VDPSAFALGCNASFVARSVDVEAQHLCDVLRRAAAHKGSAFIEIYQNCNVFNDLAFESFRAKEVKAERQLRVQHGKPMLFGAQQEKGLRVDPKTLQLEVVTMGENGVTEADVIVHDETNSTLASMLARMPFPKFPVALGVLYAVSRPTYDATLREQRQNALKRQGKPDLQKLLESGNTWQV
jgi:2-oxoglutarate ferredoxin oxidoreductase subunit beta